MVLAEFECQGYRFALPVAFVRRVMPSAQPTPLPGAPAIVLGMLDLGGELAIVINFFHRIGLPFAGINVAQHLLVLEIPGMSLGIVVDRVHGVLAREVKSEINIPEKFTTNDYVESVIRTDDGLCIICDPEKFLLEDEKISIDGVIGQLGHAEH